MLELKGDSSNDERRMSSFMVVRTSLSAVTLRGPVDRDLFGRLKPPGLACVEELRSKPTAGREKNNQNEKTEPSVEMKDQQGGISAVSITWDSTIGVSGFGGVFGRGGGKESESDAGASRGESIDDRAESTDSWSFMSSMLSS